MFKLMLWQFRYSWRKWVGTLFVFTAAGVALGFTFIGLFSAINIYMGNGGPSAGIIFTMPGSFGVITIILIINGVTRLLINSFSKDYRLWGVLGANPNQLSMLVSGQMTLLSLIGAIFGYFLSYPIVSSFYSWMLTTPGSNGMPAIPMHLSLQSFMLTILFVGVLTAIASFFDSRRIFVKKQKHFFKFKKLRGSGMSPIRYLFSFASLAGLIYLYSIFFQKPLKAQKIFSSKGLPLVDTYTKAFLLYTIVAIVTFSLLAPLFLPFIIRLLFKFVPHNWLKTFTTAYYNVLSKKDFLNSVVVPLFTFSFFASYFTYMTLDLESVNVKARLAGIMGTAIFMFGEPFLVIFANIISITIISSPQRNESVGQLQLLGFSFTDLLGEKSLEAMLYAGVIFVSGVINNAFLFSTIIKAAQNTAVTAKSNWLSITYWPMIAGITAFLFIVIIDIAHIYRVSTENEIPEVAE
ncbi:FtsX-like permease family protein [Lactobacillus acetotolerans]|uniref:FtsX-like permease family protein n=1 Tax=Lactobacillus acetotolerans TaxID=1600 RepID=UPI000EE489B8|nr:FtsX-like permease family protein [Lactobacillus acetotolerans]HCX40548.1 hypothetical protein [Lactobacillus acetotolerans]